MRKIYVKFIVIALELAMAIGVITMSSYAWLVLSNNPVANGIQITIGGGNTILVAADITEEVDGVVYHYPDRFGDTLNFSQHESYDYLNEIGALTPVSTADGLNWFLPVYYDINDQEVKEGQVLSGTLKSIAEFTLDKDLKYANISEEEAETAEGSYMYLDFWVTSPGSDYTLRVSTGEDSGGSFAIGLANAEENNGSYVLKEDEGGSASCVRVGMLVNPDDITDNTMVYYQDSHGFDAQYSKLRGGYMEPEGGYVDSDNYRFTIYEPNGDVHSETVKVKDGTYVPTTPLGIIGAGVERIDIRDRVSVQVGSEWAEAEIGTGTQIEQRFQTAIIEPSFQGLSEAEIENKFYKEYLGNQVAPYVKKGMFVKSTKSLYNATVATGAAPSEYMSGDYIAGATDDVYIVKLEKNVPQRIRLFIWLEGEDVDCVNSASASAFAFRIELAGSNADDNVE